MTTTEIINNLIIKPEVCSHSLDNLDDNQSGNSNEISTSKSRKRQRLFIPPMSYDWYTKACKSNCVGAVEALACCYFLYITGSKKPFHITKERATEFGLKNNNKKNKALNKLAEIGLISITPRLGKSHEITFNI